MSASLPRTKIVATIGPASESEEVLRALIRAGLDVARLNFSHATHDWAHAVVERIRRIAAEEGETVAVLQDLQGPRLRVGPIAGGQVALVPGARLLLTPRDVPGDQTAVRVDYAPLARDLRPGNRVLIDDGLLELEVERVDAEDVLCLVRTGGTLRSHKGINLPDARISAPALTEKDHTDARFGATLGVDYVALSFVRNATDVLALRAVLSEAASTAPIVAKIERPEGVAEFDAILQVVDGVMVARGDLGIEMGPEQVPLIQKQLIRRCRAAGKPVITATQMLESMVVHPRPTRAEASDVANAILDGTDAVMLSAETASGAYPVEAVRTMARIAGVAERALPEADYMAEGAAHPIVSVTNAITAATVATAEQLGVRLIVTLTESGHTARMVAKHRPATPILAVTPNPETRARLALVWGVQPVEMARLHDDAEMFAQCIRLARAAGAEDGDLVAVTAGLPLATPGRTNLLRIHLVGDEGGHVLPHDH
jgi:pyruvate kinase